MKNIYQYSYFLEKDCMSEECEVKEQTNQFSQPGAEVQNMSGDLSHPNFKGNELPDFGKKIADTRKKDIVEQSMRSWIKI